MAPGRADDRRVEGPKPGATKTGARVSIKPLCTIRATLTVTDSDDKDSDSVLVRVAPRPWKTPPLEYRPTREPMTVPWFKCDSTDTCRLELDGGMNIPDPVKCPGQTTPGSQVICPLLNGKSTWNGAGYTLATLSDPNGPFDGYLYVRSTSLAVKELGILNRYLFPEAAPEIDGHSFYTYNKTHGTKVDGFLNALSEREGWGAPGKKHTGHAQATQEDLANPRNDPRPEIERLIARSAVDLQEAADKRIKEIDDLLQSDTCDKGPKWGRLNEIGKFELYFFRVKGLEFSWVKTTIVVT